MQFPYEPIIRDRWAEVEAPSAVRSPNFIVGMHLSESDERNEDETVDGF
jgi:hypothetical protein